MKTKHSVVLNLGGAVPQSRCFLLQVTAAVLLTIVLLSHINGTKEEDPFDFGAHCQMWLEEFEPPFDTDLGAKNYDDVDKDIFIPLGYKMKERSTVPTLDYTEPLNCSAVFESFSESRKTLNESTALPDEVPWKLKGQYLLNGYAHLIKVHKNERPSLTDKSVNRLLHHPMKLIGMAANNSVREALRFTVKSCGMEGKKGITIDPQSSSVYKLNREHASQYDFVVSFSEHSRLGRYEDVLNPNSDLHEAQNVLCLLKSGGLFFVSIHIGWDILHWNLHRIYGRVRLALFTAGFDIVDVFYRGQKVELNMDWFYKPQDIERNAKINYGEGSLWKQAVFILKKR